MSDEPGHVAAAMSAQRSPTRRPADFISDRPRTTNYNGNITTVPLSTSTHHVVPLKTCRSLCQRPAHLGPPRILRAGHHEPILSAHHPAKSPGRVSGGTIPRPSPMPLTKGHVVRYRGDQRRRRFPKSHGRCSQRLVSSECGCPLLPQVRGKPVQSSHPGPRPTGQKVARRRRHRRLPIRYCRCL